VEYRSKGDMSTQQQQQQLQQQEQKFYCPTCGLETNKTVGSNIELEIHITYKTP
jgi:hypothetical protein